MDGSGVRTGGRGAGRARAARMAAALLLAGGLNAPRAGAAADPERAVACDDAAASPAWPRLLVDATGLHSRAGNVTVTVYGEDPSHFLKHAGSLAVIRVPIMGAGAERTAEACVALSRPGDYAIAIYHDENNNHHFDRNFLGLPAEGYGFSNDAPTPFGPPRFAAARIAIGAGTRRIAIRVRY